MTVKDVALGLTWQQLAQAVALKAGADNGAPSCVRDRPAGPFELRLTMDDGPLVVVQATGVVVSVGVIG